MKNIHLLPTDKPSKIFYIAENFHLEKGQLIEPKSYHNVYITSDEEIKEDYVFAYGVVIKVMMFDEKTLYFVNGTKAKREDCNKIILTTDQDLIKDGVQAIDNEFLEWFVKNPSCDEVEVGYGWIRLTETDNEGYWVSIPDKQFEMQQEEPKQDYSKIKEGLKKSIKGKAHFIQHFKNGGTVEEFKPLEPKQETIEEAMDKNGYHDEVNDTMWREGVKFGAKWQQENIIEELEMHILINEDDWNRNPHTQLKDFINSLNKQD